MSRLPDAKYGPGQCGATALSALLLTAVFLLLLWAPAMAEVRATQAIGHCLLQGETHHAGSWVIFEAVTPSAETDSTQTGNDGSYAISLAEGYYTLNCRHVGFLDGGIATAFAVMGGTTVLDTITLVQGVTVSIEGTVSGTWTREYRYDLVGDAIVSAGDTLTIEPGVLVTAMGDFDLDVEGVLTAIGAPGDSIVFTSGQPEPYLGDWQGIQINDGDGISTFAFCRIEYAWNGVHAIGSECLVHDCLIRNSHQYGIRARLASIDIRRSRIESCNSYGIYMQDTQESAIIDNDILLNGSGILLTSADPRVEFNRISRTGYGIYLTSACALVRRNYIADCMFAGVATWGVGQDTVVNNSMMACRQGVQTGYLSSPVLWNNVMLGCVAGLECGSLPGGLSNNAFRANTDDFRGDETPIGAGGVLTVNANGDSCDTYWNLFLDPEIVSEPDLDPHLRATSPLRGAGSTAPAALLPDGSAADIGAFDYDPHYFWLEICDRPDDQGGWLEAGWRAHRSDDAASPAPIELYLLERLDEGWSPVAEISASLQDSYAVAIQTADVAHVDADPETSTYRVVAVSSDPDSTTSSWVRTAWSTDDIPPPAPELMLVGSVSGNHLAWTNPEIDDFYQTRVYRSYDSPVPTIVPWMTTTQEIYEHEFLELFNYVIRFEDLHGNIGDVSNEVFGGDVTGAVLPQRIALGTCSPNPFNPAIEIEFSSMVGQRVGLRIYDALGRRVASLVDEIGRGGERKVVWRGEDDHGRRVPSGIYFVRLRGGDASDARKIVLVR